MSTEGQGNGESETLQEWKGVDGVVNGDGSADKERDLESEK